MGFFDDIIVEYPLPEDDPAEEKIDETYQTKDLGEGMYTYTITREGRLIRNAHDIDVEYHGDIIFYGNGHQYKVRFTEGQLQWIKKLW